MTHFATLAADGPREWRALCNQRHAWPVSLPRDTPNAAGERFVKGTLPQESDITCPACRTKWKAGMRRVRKLFQTYRGEE